jgi:Arc/MetJ family transcription regulator
MEVYVRTNIVLDEKLIKEAMKLANVKTKREAVEIALRRFVHSGKQKKLLELYASRGVHGDYDYKQTRTGT